MKTTLFLTILALCAICNAIVTQDFVTSDRQVYVSWQICDNCTCDYYSISAYEDTERNVSGHSSVLMSDSIYFYYVHEKYELCGSYSYEYEYETIQTPIEYLEIIPSGNIAAVDINFIDSAGNNITIHMCWRNVLDIESCDCQTIDHSGPNAYYYLTNSTYVTTNIYGIIRSNGKLILPPTGTQGYIYYYGDKSITISHP